MCFGELERVFPYKGKEEHSHVEKNKCGHAKHLHAGVRMPDGYDEVLKSINEWASIDSKSHLQLDPTVSKE